MDARFESVKRLYDRGQITTANVQIAVTKGLITQSQYKEITGQEFPIN